MKTEVPLQVFKAVCLLLALHICRPHICVLSAFDNSIEATLTCDFEDTSICGYTQDETADFNWTKQCGPTPSLETGPDNDHTLDTPMGHYMYIKASSQNDSDVARLVSSLYTPPANARCIHFWYHMHGQDIGSLWVYLQHAENNESQVFGVQGDHGNTWLNGNLEIPKNSTPFRLVFEGTVGSGDRGDIALDDVEVKKQPCGVRPAGLLHAVLFPNVTQYSIRESSEMPDITCTCGGCVPECDVVWTFNGSSLKNSSNLKIGTVSRFSSGTYTCTCKNSTFHTKSISFTLDVKYGPDEVVFSPNTSQYTVGEGTWIAPISCGCGLCNPHCSIQWVLNNNSLGANNVLHLADVPRNASGQYACFCINVYTLENKSRLIDVTVQYGPDEAILNLNNSRYSVEEGKTVPDINCFCSACVPTCNVFWLYNGIEIWNDSKLHLANISRTQTGNYTCRCSNPSIGDEKTQHLEISVVFGPDEAIISPNNTKYSVEEGNSAPVIKCSCGACVPTCDVIWIYNGTEIWKGSELQLVNIYRNQTGNYTCRCSNPSIGVEKTRCAEISVACIDFLSILVAMLEMSSTL